MKHDMFGSWIAAAAGAVVGAIIGLAACTPAPPPAPIPPDSGDGGACPAYPPGLTPCEAACAHLHDLSCPEGDNPRRCSSVCRLATSELTDLHPGCVWCAKSQEDARACSPGLACGLAPVTSTASAAPSSSAPVRHR